MNQLIELGKTYLPQSTKGMLKRLWARLPGVRAPMLIIEHMEVDFVFSQLFCKERLRVLDIGSHYGEMLDIFERHNDPHKYEVYCIEPFPDNAREIRRKLGGLRRVNARVCEAAVSDVSGTKTFFVGSADTLITCSREHMHRFGEQFKTHREFQVQAYTVGDLFRHFNIAATPQFDFVKIDVEGHDLQVVRSFVQSGAESYAIMFEFEADAEQVDVAIKELAAGGYREFFVFGRTGIATNYIGEYRDKAFFASLLQRGKFTVGNVVALRGQMAA
jgi:FkbM family methyltransferase